MKTKPLYLEDPYLKTIESTVVEVIPEGDVYRLILDQTVFYPMGGGQPTDQGTLTLSDGGLAGVYQVLLKDGEIQHFVRSPRPPQVGEKVVGTLDWERRYKNMKVHSAGHVVDFALYLLGYSPGKLKPLKGDHGKKPFIVYEGMFEKDILAELQHKVDELTSQNLKFSWSFETHEKLEKEALYLQPGLPINKPLRALRLEGVGTVADGGTIVNTVAEVGVIKIHQIENKDNTLLIYYKVGV